MRTRIEPCIVSFFLAAQSPALTARPLADPPPVHGAAEGGRAHGEGSEGERDGAAADDTVMMAHLDPVTVLFMLVVSVYWLGSVLSPPDGENPLGALGGLGDLRKENQGLKARAKHLEKENEVLGAFVEILLIDERSKDLEKENEALGARNELIRARSKRKPPRARSKRKSPEARSKRKSSEARGAEDPPPKIIAAAEKACGDPKS